MKTKNIISIVQRNNKVDSIFVNDSKFAKEYVQVNNEGGIWGNYKSTDVPVVGKLKDVGHNEVSTIVEGEHIVTVYLNDLFKAESDYARLCKDSGKEFSNYKLIHILESRL